MHVVQLRSAVTYSHMALGLDDPLMKVKGKTKGHPGILGFDSVDSGILTQGVLPSLLNQHGGLSFRVCRALKHEGKRGSMGSRQRTEFRALVL